MRYGILGHLQKLYGLFDRLSANKQRLCVFSLGFLTALGQEKYALLLLALVFFTSFLCLIIRHAQNGAGAQRTSKLYQYVFFFFFGYLTLGLHWFAYATHAELDHFWWVIPFAALGLPAFLALFYLPVAYLLKKFPSKSFLSSALMVILGVSFADYLRSHILTGLPWLLFGQMGGGEFLIHYRSLYALGGVHFVGLYLLLISVTAAMLGILPWQKRGHLSATVIILGFLIVLPLGLNQIEDRIFLREDATTKTIPIVIVQPDIPQQEKWDAFLLMQNLRTLIDLSKAVSLPHQQVTYLWPEAAIPSVLNAEKNAFYANITAFMREKDLLITGAPRYFEDVKGDRIYRNSLVLLDHRGKEIFNYDKIHLVPFGEYVPLRQYVGDFIDSFVPGRYDYAAGDLNQQCELPHKGCELISGVVPLICYEGIFGNEVRQRVLLKKDPTFLLNLTNDGWFLDSSGPYQHLHISKIRAVELGLPLVRVAWRGISVIVDFKGQESLRIDYGQAQAKFYNLLISKRKTFFRAMGDKIYYSFFAFLVLIMISLHYRERKVL